MTISVLYIPDILLTENRITMLKYYYHFILEDYVQLSLLVI